MPWPRQPAAAPQSLPLIRSIRRTNSPASFRRNVDEGWCHCGSVGPAGYLHRVRHARLAGGVDGYELDARVLRSVDTAGREGHHDPARRWCQAVRLRVEVSESGVAQGAGTHAVQHMQADRAPTRQDVGAVTRQRHVLHRIAKAVVTDGPRLVGSRQVDDHQHVGCCGCDGGSPVASSRGQPVGQNRPRERLRRVAEVEVVRGRTLSKCIDVVVAGDMPTSSLQERAAHHLEVVRIGDRDAGELPAERVRSDAGGQKRRGATGCTGAVVQGGRGR